MSAYQIEVPDEFGVQFRKIRNRTTYATTKRSFPGADFSRIEFYVKFHRFAYLLYFSSQWLWTVKDIEGYDWMAIEQFDFAV